MRKRSDDPGRLIALIDRHAAAAGTLWVAYSGGRDSTVLLHLVAGTRAALAPRTVRAVHVNHGLNPAAPRWAAHCEKVGAQLGVPVQVLEVDARPRAGEGPQAGARRARYAALRALLRPGDVLLTAHHRRDQAETVLLRALRGTGPDGLAAMAPARRCGPGWLIRPLLDWPDAQVEAYARHCALAWVDDPGNTAPRHARAWVRTVLWPTLTARWPGAEAALARLADHARAAREAQPDPPSELRVAALRALSGARRAQAVRRYLAAREVPPPPAARLAEGLRALLEAGIDRRPALVWGGYSLRRYRDRVHLLPARLPAPPSQSLVWCPRDGALDVPGLGRLALQSGGAGGFALARLAPDVALEVRFRAGGERLRLPGGHREVKKLFQEAGIPPWARARWPLLYRAGECVGVPGVALALPWAARANEPAWQPHWAAAAGL